MTDDVLEGIEWKLDCQGKQDFDGELVYLSCRYYPRGGGFAALTFIDGSFKGWEPNEHRPEIKPSAYTGIYIQGDKLAEATFEGETEAEVKEQVERWAREQIERLYAMLFAAYEVRETKGEL